MQKRVVEPQADETRSETEKVTVETRLTAEQFYEQWLQNNKFESHPTREQIYQLLEAFRDKSEAALRFSVASLSDAVLVYENEAVGLREEIERLQREFCNRVHTELDASERARTAEAEAAALRERERWISVEERLPEYEEPVWGLLPYESGEGYALAIVERGYGEDGWLWSICKEWSGASMIDWPKLAADADFECDDDYHVKYWLPLKALSAAPEAGK